MNDQVLVKVENVSKKFCKDLKTSLWYGVKDLRSEFLGLHSKKDLRDKEFWAVKDITFELKRGECLGLIGHNGAGKSTLLKMLNGLIKPDQGKITMRGRIGALIELGAGFNPLLTGRENVYINGQILGFSKREIDQKFDAILSFAELEEFIDTPVQNYSSGMKVRLGFAVAAQMEPDVLIIDEVLAVGDLGFRAKCFNRINEIQNNAVVIFVSHAVNQVSRLCTSIIHMKKGSEAYKGNDLSVGIEQFLNEFGSEKFKIVGKRDAIKSTELTINKINYSCKEEVKLKQFDTVNLNLSFAPNESNEKFGIQISIFDRELKGVAIIAAENSSVVFISRNGICNVDVKFTNHLAPGKYSMNIHFSKLDAKGNYVTLCSYMHIVNLSVTGSKLYTFIPVHFEAQWDGTLEILNEKII